MESIQTSVHPTSDHRFHHRLQLPIRRRRHRRRRHRRRRILLSACSSWKTAPWTTPTGKEKRSAVNIRTKMNHIRKRPKGKNQRLTCSSSSLESVVSSSKTTSCFRLFLGGLGPDFNFFSIGRPSEAKRSQSTKKKFKRNFWKTEPSFALFHLKRVRLKFARK